MQSVYQRSLGQRFVTSTAPGLMLPTSVEPMSLERALHILAGSMTRLLEAVWTIVRALGPAAIDYHGDPEVGLHRYPAAVLEVLDEHERDQLATFESLRDDYCREAELFAAAIVAFAAKDDCWKRFDDICCEYFGKRRDGGAGPRPRMVFIDHPTRLPLAALRIVVRGQPTATDPQHGDSGLPG